MKPEYRVAVTTRACDGKTVYAVWHSQEEQVISRWTPYGRVAERWVRHFGPGIDVIRYHIVQEDA